MTYIGAEPDAAFTTTAKQTLTGTGVATYTLDHAVSSESDIRVYVDNVHQEGGTGKAYTVDGNQITFTENITSSMDCYVIFSAMALQTTAPAADSISTGMIKDDQITTAKIASNAVSTAKLFSGFANGITMADQFRLASSKTSNGDCTDWERPTDANGNDMLFAQLGTGMTVSSGVFTFPSTGYYVVFEIAAVYAASGDGAIGLELHITEDNSTYVVHSTAAGMGGSSGVNRGEGSQLALLNITDTANQKVKFVAASVGSSSEIMGDPLKNRTSVTFIRIADSQ